MQPSESGMARSSTITQLKSPRRETGRHNLLTMGRQKTRQGQASGLLTIPLSVSVAQMKV